MSWDVKIGDKSNIHMQKFQLQIVYKGPLICIMGWDLIRHKNHKC